MAQASSNVTAGAAVRRSSPVSVLLVAAPVTVLIALVVAGMSGPPPAGGALAWGASAGVLGGVGLWCSYRAFELGRVAVVVPVTSCAATAVQVGAGWWLEGRPAVGTLAGAVVCLASVVLIARGGQDAGHGQRPVVAVLLALAAGVCFAGFVVFISRGGDASAGWALGAARVGVLAVVLLIGAAVRPGLPRGTRAWALACAAGVLDVTSNLLLLAALSAAALALVSAVTAIAPVIAAVLAITFLGERLTRDQVAGLILAMCGVWLVILT